MNFTTPNFTTLTAVDRSYVLHWMFKFAGNADPSTAIPGGDFRDPTDSFGSEAEVGAFLGTRTNFKLFNRLQIKYTVGPTGFKGTPKIIQQATAIGDTKNPCGSVLGFLDIFPGQAGPRNGPPPVIMADRVSLINDGSPDTGAIRAFNTLTGKGVPSPVFWENIGSQVRFTSVGGPSPATTLVQPYPTYYEYRNGRRVNVTPQAATPLAHFYTNPYPFGTASCTLLGGTTPGGRCGDASSPPHPTARTPAFIAP